MFLVAAVSVQCWCRITFLIYYLETCASRQTNPVILFNSNYYSALFMCHNIVLPLLFY